MRKREGMTILLLAALPLLLLAGGVWAQENIAVQRLAEPLGFVATSHTQHLAVAFDQETRQLVGDPINLSPEGNGPFDAVMRRDGSEVWLAGFSGDGIIVIDAHTHTLIQRIGDVGNTPVDIEFNKTGDLAYVSNRDSVDVAVIDTATYQVIDRIPIVSPTITNVDAGRMSLNPCSGELYMVNYFDGQLWRVDPVAKQVTEEIDLGVSLWNPVVSPQADRLYVTDRSRFGDVVHVLDVSGSSFITLTQIPVGDDPWGVDISPNGRLLTVANATDGTITLINTDTLTVTHTITLTVPGSSDQPEPRDVEISADGRFAYAPSLDVGLANDEDAVLIIDLETGEQVDAIKLGATRRPVVVSIAPASPSLDPIPGFGVAGALTVGTAVSFTDSSGNQPTSWQWDFGDGVGSSSEQNPVYSYANPGSYTVTLTATNPCGSQTISQTIEIEAERNVYLPVIKRSEG